MLWLARRIVIAVLVIWAVASLAFLAIRVAPDPTGVAALHEQFGLDRSALPAYIARVIHLLTGDLGRSLQDGSSVAWQIGRRLPLTLELIGFAVLFALLIGVPGGLFTAIGRGGTSVRITSWLSAFAIAVPVFVVGSLSVLLFGNMLRWMPAGGYVPPAVDPLPAIVLALAPSAIVFRMTRAAVLDVMQRGFVRTARAKGITSKRVLVHHVLRNALMPVMAALGLYLGTLLGATVLVEYIFDYPGLGGLLVAAVKARDYPTVEGVVLIFLVLGASLSLVVDLIRVVLDPRLRAA